MSFSHHTACYCVSTLRLPRELPSSLCSGRLLSMWCTMTGINLENVLTQCLSSVGTVGFTWPFLWSMTSSEWRSHLGSSRCACLLVVHSFCTIQGESCTADLPCFSLSLFSSLFTGMWTQGVDFILYVIIKCSSFHSMLLVNVRLRWRTITTKAALTKESVQLGSCLQLQTVSLR